MKKNNFFSLFIYALISVNKTKRENAEEELIKIHVYFYIEHKKLILSLKPKKRIAYVSLPMR